MTTHSVGTREEWRRARLELLDAETDLTRRSDELARRRQQLPWVPVEKEYVFDTEGGEASLGDLFAGRSQLLVYHFMFPPSWDEGCPSCSSIAESFDGIRVHLEHHDVGLITVSRAPIEKLEAYKARMGWAFPWVSSSGNDFNIDFGVSFREHDLAAHRAEYNFRPAEVDVSTLPNGGAGHELVDDGESPGMSAFALDDDVVFHTYSAYSRGLDALWGMYPWLDRAPLGRNEDGMWWRRHDQYDD